MTTPTNAPAFETKAFIFGMDTSAASEEELIDAIRKIEQEISSLESIKTQSARIDAKVSDLKKSLNQIANVLDSKV